MEQVLLVVHLLVSVALVIVVLLQKTGSDGGGLMGGGNTMGGLFTARGSANLLTRTTAILATIMICSSLLLGYIASAGHTSRSLADKLVPATTTEQPDDNAAKPTTESPAVPEVPVSK